MCLMKVESVNVCSWLSTVQVYELCCVTKNEALFKVHSRK